MWLTKVPAVQSRGLSRSNRSDSNLGGLSGRNLPIPQRTRTLWAGIFHIIVLVEFRFRRAYESSR